jgi:dienelactone hydrolase
MSEAGLGGFQRQAFSADIAGRPACFDVYTIGKGPPVIVMQEMPGIGQAFLRFCRRLAAEGFEVWVPHWFGPLGRTSGANVVRMLCMRREFQVFARRKSSAIVDWMRALCAHVSEVRRAERVGVIGMCLSGNFAMTLIADEHVWAAVASQPSIPPHQPSLHMSDAEVAASRAALDAKGPMYAYRFRDDPLCTSARFDAIDRAFNDDGVRVVLNVIEGGGHSVLAGHYDDTPGSGTAKALAEVIGYLRQQLSRQA